MPLTDYAKAIVLDLCQYVGLFSAAPSSIGGGVEISGAGYARQPLSVTLAGDQALSSAPVTFASTGPDWDVATHIGLFDAPAGGNLIDWAEIPPFQCRAGRSYTVRPGDLKVDFQ